MSMADDPDARFAVGYRIENPDAPPEQRRFVPINPELQARAEKLFREISEDAIALAANK